MVFYIIKMTKFKKKKKRKGMAITVIRGGEEQKRNWIGK